MSVPYDIFIGEFLEKITEYDFIQFDEEDRTAKVDGYMKRAFSAFRRNCKYDFFTTGDDENRVFDVEIADEDLAEIADIVSEGMVVQWLKPYLNKQDILENVMTTSDFKEYSPAELLRRIGSAHKQALKDYKQMIREYSFNHGDLSDLHI
jgi:hypothetical protein